MADLPSEPLIVRVHAAEAVERGWTLLAIAVRALVEALTEPLRATPVTPVTPVTQVAPLP
ncbi:hypothetical protein BH24ACT6_BH24ACT6_06740 [soil metagenome]